MPVEQRKLDFPLTRTPLAGIDVEDTEAIRAWLLRATEHRVRHQGALPSRFRYLTADKEEALDVGEPELGDEAFHALFFRQLGERPGIRRRFREGELRVEVEGSHRRAIVLLEHLPSGNDDGWWLAWRLVGAREGQVGVFHGDWVLAEGVGTDSIPEPFREWLHQAGEVTHSELKETPTEFPSPEILFGTAELPEPVPPDPLQVVEIVGQLTDGEIAKGGLAGVMVVAFRERVSEQFLVKGKLPFPVDDLVRNIALQGPVDAVALIFAGVVNLDGLDTRAIVMVVEMPDGRRAQRIVPVKWRPDGSIEAPRSYRRAMPTPEPSQRWIGVTPGTEIQMFPVPPAAGPVPEG